MIALNASLFVLNVALYAWQVSRARRERRRVRRIARVRFEL
jgi:hypothetical protein